MDDQAVLESQAAPSRGMPIDAKIKATLTAKACLAGVILHFLEDDFGAALIVASKWSLTRQMHTVPEVTEFLERLGGPGA
jgi:hypothetical protein